VKPRPDRITARLALPAIPPRLTIDFLVKSLRFSWRRAKKHREPTAFAFFAQSTAMMPDGWVASTAIGDLYGVARACESMLARIESEAPEHRDPRLLGARFLLRDYIREFVEKAR